MGIKKEKFERIVNGKKHVIYPEEIKQKIVKELENGLLSVKEAMRKYEINQAGTIQGWLKKYSEQYRNEQMRVIYTDAQRRQIIYKIETGVLNIKVAAERYRIEQDTIKDWIKLYACEVTSVNSMKKKTIQSQGDSDDAKELQRQVEMLKLKVAGLEMMIDIAEKELKIDIRKKSGTKQ